ncbi:SgcJ/EcaC family oxidoreductase [Actinokineospora sp.]|uniref:SgcJ/EcaC family oxidoreductase n=1 Tax=Actinokineospora sp. TaxID=1872133 RepID=UPI004037E500
MSKASSLVAGAKKWASHYGAFAGGKEGAVLSVPLRIRGAWEQNDADVFADVFTNNGSLLIGDDQLTSRDEIRAHMATGFASHYKGASLVDEPLEIRFLTDDVALAITEGGVLYAGETELPAERVVRTMWVIARQDGEWKLVSHQTSPLNG